MTKNMNTTSGILLLVTVFMVFTLLNNSIFSNVRVDLTENNLFTLSDGTKEIVASIDEPINLYFFFSQAASKDLTSLRAYAVRVQELLEEYELRGKGKINLQIVDPEPFSEAEDQAAEFGLQSIPVSTTGDELYFGLAGTNAVDDLAVISFFQPDKEEFLEYEISKLIQGLIVVDKPVVGLLSGLPVQGAVDMNSFATTPPWMVIAQLEHLFSIEEIDEAATELPEGIELLFIIHPKNLSESMLFSIDQFVMTGGKLLAFVDPLAEMDRPAQSSPMMPSISTGQSSDLNRLMANWGISLRQGVILGDARTALSVSGVDGSPVRHLAILGMGVDNLDDQDVVTNGLETVNLATAGIIDVQDDASVQVSELITSSTQSMPMESLQFQFLANPADLQKSFVPTGERYIVAARLSGVANTAFPDGLAGSDVKTSTDNLNVILVADTDLLTDRLWVQVQEFFGQRIASPWANNGDFVVNALDNLVGSSALISIRSRGRFSRPFSVVEDLRREAEARYLKSAEDLQVELSETERKLSELQSSEGAGSLLSLTPEQEAALVQFQEEKLRIRKELRQVRHQLNDDIESLGATLKFVNIALVPLLLTLLLIGAHYLRLSRNKEAGR